MEVCDAILKIVCAGSRWFWHPGGVKRHVYLNTGREVPHGYILHRNQEKARNVNVAAGHDNEDNKRQRKTEIDTMTFWSTSIWCWKGHVLTINEKDKQLFNGRQAWWLLYKFRWNLNGNNSHLKVQNILLIHCTWDDVVSRNILYYSRYQRVKN